MTYQYYSHGGLIDFVDVHSVNTEHAPVVTLKNIRGGVIAVIHLKPGERLVCKGGF